MEPGNHLFEKENHLNHLPSCLWVQNVNFPCVLNLFEEYEVSANALRLMDAENAAQILEHVEDYEVQIQRGGMI